MSWRALLPLGLFLALAIVSGVVLMRGGARHDLSESGLIGRAAPPMALERLGGGPPVNGDALADAYLVNVFASWCAPCRVEHPVLLDLKRAGVPIVGIAYKDKPEAAAAFLSELGDPFSMVGLDPEGRYGLDLGVAGVPETFVIRADGTIAAIHRGPLDEDVVREKILPALKEP